MPKQSLEEKIAEEDRKNAARRERLAARKARSASKEVRGLERDFSVVDRLTAEYGGNTTLDKLSESIDHLLTQARASALSASLARGEGES